MIALRMSKPTTAVILGADRVGKSTLISYALERFKRRDVDAMTLHFSGPKPHHSSPIEQYIEPFDIALDSMPEFILCDRGFSEVCFYDRFRRHVDISHEWAQAAESYFLCKSKAVHVFLLKRSWEWSKPHHIKEIVEQQPDATAWWIKNQLEMREAEHYAYYEYMQEYLDNLSLLPYTKLDNPKPDFDLFDLIVDV